MTAQHDTPDVRLKRVYDASAPSDGLRCWWTAFGREGCTKPT